MQVHRSLGSSCSCLACRTQRRHVSQLFGSKLDQGKAKENALLSPRHSTSAAPLTESFQPLLENRSYRIRAAITCMVAEPGQ